MPKVRFVKIITSTSEMNGWRHQGVIGQTYEVLDIISHGYVKVKYGERLYGWLPLEVCEVNPHLKLVK